MLANLKRSVDVYDLIVAFWLLVTHYIVVVSGIL